MSKDNYVKVMSTATGWRFEEYYWETKGHYWHSCMYSDTYGTEAEAVSSAEAYAIDNDMEFRR